MTGLQVLLAVLAGSFSTTVETGTAALVPHDGAYRPELPGMHCVPSTGGVLSPSRIFFVPVPPEVRPVLDFSVDAVSATGHHDALWLMVPSVAGSGMETTETYGSTPSVPPSDAVTMRVIPLAGTTVAMVTVSPFCFGDLSRYASRISFSVSWPERGGGRPVEGSLLEGVAPDGSPWWRDRRRAVESPFWGRPWARIKVTETGFHAITGQQLQDAGCQVAGMPSESFSMLSGPGIPFDLGNYADEHLPVPVALSISDGGDGLFDPSDTLFFYGSALVRAVADGDSLGRTWHRYDDSNTYWLTWGGSPGLRMETSDASLQGYPDWGPVAPQLFWLEQDYSWCVEEDRTGWCWSPIPQGSPSYIYFSPPPGSSGRTMRVSIMHPRVGSGTDSLVLNGVTLVDTSFVNNRYMWLWTIDDPPLNQGMNSLKIWSSNTEGSSEFNYLELELEVPVSPDRQLFFIDRPAGEYTFEVPGVEPGARAFMTGSPFTPVELVGWTVSGGVAGLSVSTDPTGSLWIVNPGSYLQPASIEYAQPGRIVGTGQEGGVIVLFPEELAGYAAGIEAVYAARGISIYPATYREVYDEFNQGVESPGAVRSFVRHALDNWVDPPQALLLVGDSNHDPLGHTTGERPFAPLFRTIGASDNKYGSGDGGFVTVHDGAIAPEIPVSRLPVSSGAELQEYLDRLVAFERVRSDGLWANRMVVAADDEWNGSIFSETVHTLAAEMFTNSVIPFSLDVRKVYLIDYPWPPGTSPDGVHPEKPEARADFSAAINQGCSLVVFYGHGSYNQIAQENLLSTLDVPGLMNGPRFPVAFFASCNTGQFDMLGADCFSEVLVKHLQGGAIAAIGSSDISTAPQNTLLLGVFLESVYGPQRMSVSKALWKARLEAPGFYWNHYYNVLGDGGVVPPMGNDDGTLLRIPATGLLRGRSNTVELGFQEQLTFQVSVSESGDSVVYVSPLSGVSIPWIRMGEDAFRGVFETGPDGTMDLQFFMPVQSDTGSLARAHATGTIGTRQNAAWEQWFAVADSGGYSPDSIGPDITMRHVRSGLSNLLMAELEDESGISIFGSSAGRAILLSIDSQGFDVSQFFQYLPGSHTRGVLTYALPDLSAGIHTLILAAWDGMGNGSLDTLEVTIAADGDRLLGGVAVYPNPGSGARAFIFETSEPGQIGVAVYSTAGRPIWEGQVSHAGGSGQLVWCGRDADNDRPASGAYIYRVTLETADGRRASSTGLLAVSPEPER